MTTIRPPSTQITLMAEKSEKKFDHEVASTGTPSIDGSSPFYDPSKESIWTRLGVNFESFKRAPGTTGYVHHIVFGTEIVADHGH